MKYIEKPKEAFRTHNILKVIPIFKGKLFQIPEWKRKEAIEYLQNPIVVQETLISNDSRFSNEGHIYALGIVDDYRINGEDTVFFRDIINNSYGHIALVGLLEGTWRINSMYPEFTYEIIGRYNELIDKGLLEKKIFEEEIKLLKQKEA